MFMRSGQLVIVALLAVTTVATPAGPCSANLAPELLASAATYNRLACPSQSGCAAVGLQLVAQRRANAAEADTEGTLLQQGNQRFDDSRDAGALARLATAKARRKHEGGVSYGEARWNSFYSDWLIPIFTFMIVSAITALILLSLSGLATRAVVGTGSVTWSKYWRWPLGSIALLLVFGASIIPPAYSMFKPFKASSVPAWARDYVAPCIVGAILFMSMAAAIGGQFFDTKETPELFEGNESERRWHYCLRHASVDWGRRLFTPVLLITVLDLALPCLGVLKRPQGRLLVEYLMLSAVGILLTAAVFGQNLRLQVAVQSASDSTTTDPVDTDYLLARLRTLGRESPRELSATNGSSATTPLSTALSTQNLSVLPAGKFLGALSSLFFALRPDLTWRARASLVDDNRIAVSLTRNSRQAASVIFSRRDLGLPTLSDSASARRGKAQLLTGAAVFILLELSNRHPELRGGLCGAREWRSVTLQVIATSNSLLEPPEEKMPLLARAVNEDPGNALARCEYLWAIQQAIDFSDPQYEQFAEDIDAELKALKEHWRLLRIRGWHLSAAQWINLHMQSDRQDIYPLKRAEYAVEQLEKALKDATRRLHTKAVPELQLLAEQTVPIARSLRASISALNRNRSISIGQRKAPTPQLAYDHACTRTIERSVAHQPQPALRAMHDLRLALPTEDDKRDAWKDPCLRPLRSTREFQQLTGCVPPTSILDLPYFSPCKAQLEGAGLNKANELVRAMSTPARRHQLANWLNVSLFQIERCRDIALLAELLRELRSPLDNPAIINLLVEEGVDSPLRLRKQTPEDLLARLKTRANDTGVQLCDVTVAKLGEAVLHATRPIGWLTPDW